MMNARAFALSAALALVACDTSDPTSAVVDNGYPAPTVVYQVWWSVTLFADPVAAGAESDANRVVAGSDYAYALLAPNWDPTSSTPPATLIPVRTKGPLAVARGDTLHIAISGASVDGDCAAGSRLSHEDAQFIVQRIFPGEFAGADYDETTCTTTTRASDAGGAGD
jgi:hypothetical protein